MNRALLSRLDKLENQTTKGHAKVISVVRYPHETENEALVRDGHDPATLRASDLLVIIRRITVPEKATNFARN